MLFVSHTDFNVFWSILLLRRVHTYYFMHSLLENTSQPLIKLKSKLWTILTPWVFSASVTVVDLHVFGVTVPLQGSVLSYGQMFIVHSITVLNPAPVAVEQTKSSSLQHHALVLVWGICAKMLSLVLCILVFMSKATLCRGVHVHY